MYRFETNLANPEALCQGLQLTVRTSRARRALLIVIGEEKLDGNSADFADILGGGLDLQSGLRGRGARAHDSPALNLDKAEAAGAVDAEFGVVAEGGQIDLGFAKELEQVPLAFNGHVPAVDRDRSLR